MEDIGQRQDKDGRCKKGRWKREVRDTGLKMEDVGQRQDKNGRCMKGRWKREAGDTGSKMEDAGQRQGVRQQDSKTQDLGSKVEDV